MKDIIKQRFLNKSTEELLEIVKTGQPSYTYDAIEVAEEVLSERNVTFTSKIKFQKKGSFENSQRKKVEDAAVEDSGSGLIYKILGITALCCFIGLFVCQNTGLVTTYVNLDIDNPTDKELSMTFDEGEPILVAPNKSTQVSIPVGSTKFKMEGLERTLFFKKGERYLLNPTGTEYVREEAVYRNQRTQIYSESDQSKYYKRIPFNIIMVDTLAVMGPYSLSNDLLITNWEYDLDSPLPPSVEVSQNAGSVSKIKIYRKPEFMERQKTTQFLQNWNKKK